MSNLDANVIQDQMSNYTNGGGGPVSPLQFEYTSIVLGKTSGKVYFFSTGITNGKKY